MHFENSSKSNSGLTRACFSRKGPDDLDQARADSVGYGRPEQKEGDERQVPADHR
jgi:hypothetical protein